MKYIFSNYSTYCTFRLKL